MNRTNSLLKSLNATTRGSALLSVFILLATVTIVVTEMAERQFMDIKRTGNLVDQDQAFVYATAAEALAIRVLLDDYETEKEGGEEGAIIDHLNDEWHKKVSFPLEGGAITAQLTDLQGRFNLNDLASDRWQARNRFKRLLTNLDLVKEADPDQMIKSLIEWLDENDESDMGGAEDLHYLGLDPPYRTANSLILSVDELRSVDGFTPEIVQKLTPYVAAIPEGARVNINTANVETLTTFSNIGDLQKLVEGREEEGFKSVNEAFAAAGANQANGQLDTDAFAVQSQYFLLEARAVINGRTARLRSVIYRPLVPTNKDPIKVILRNRARQFG